MADNKSRHLCLEVYLSTTFDDGVAHGLNHLRQTVGADMWMGIGKYGSRSPVLAKHIQDFLCVAAFLASGV